MIRDITQSTLNAFQASMILAEMALPKASAEGFEWYRSEALSLLKEIGGFDDFDIPATPEVMEEREIEIISDIMQRLSLLRSRINGDVLPLTFFMLTYCICRGVLLVAFDEKEAWEPYRTLLQSCFDDLGLDRDEEIAMVEYRSRALVTNNEAGEDFVTHADRIETVAELIRRILDRIYQRWSSTTELAEQVALLNSTVEEFRRESHEEHQEILESIADLREELAGRLIAQGIKPAEAEAAVDFESEGFLDRVRRWSKSQKARDALEEAMWAALDFVPGGVGVKLGIKVLAAVRKSLKK